MIAGTLTRVPETVGEVLDPALAAQLDRLDILSRRTFAGKLQGERRSKRRGRSVEFDDYREYVPGDDLRHVDWNVLARLDRLVVKVFQEEEDLAVHLVLDASASMNAGPGPANKLLYAVRLTAALGAIALAGNNRVLCSVVGASAESARPATVLRRMEPLRGRRNIQRLSQFLLDNAFAGLRGGSSADFVPGMDFAPALRTIASAHATKAVYVVISDLLIPPLDPPGYREGLRYLAALGGGGADGGAGSAAPRVSGGVGAATQETYVLQVLAPGELDPIAETRRDEPRAAGEGAQNRYDEARREAVYGDLRLIDAESGRAAEVTITPELLTQYKASVRAFIDEAHAWCTTRGMSHRLLTTDTPLSGVIVRTLRECGLLR
jgi:hypothetical protein